MNPEAPIDSHARERVEQFSRAAFGIEMEEAFFTLVDGLTRACRSARAALDAEVIAGLLKLTVRGELKPSEARNEVRRLFG